MLMRSFAFAITTLGIGAAAALSSQPAAAATYHHKRNVTLTVSERVSNAQASLTPASDSARAARYYDEALSPPAGQ